MKPIRLVNRDQLPPPGWKLGDRLIESSVEVYVAPWFYPWYVLYREFRDGADWLRCWIVRSLR